MKTCKRWYTFLKSSFTCDPDLYTECLLSCEIFHHNGVDARIRALRGRDQQLGRAIRVTDCDSLCHRRVVLQPHDDWPWGGLSKRDTSDTVFQDWTHHPLYFSQFIRMLISINFTSKLTMILTEFPALTTLKLFMLWLVNFGLTGIMNGTMKSASDNG